MRLEVTIPDRLFSEAEQAASSNGLSIEKYLVGALKRRLNDEEPKVKLSPEQIALVKEAQAEIKAGQFITMEESKKLSEASRAAWLRENRQS